jgi:thiamine biosynthesis lipoprotein
MRITALIVLFTWFLKGGEHLKKIQLSGFTQGTTYHITYYAPDTLVAKSDVEDILNSLDSSLSIYKPYSLITSFNNSDSGTEIDAHLYNVVQKSLETYRLTEGLFDVTILPLVDAWGFGSKKQSLVSDSASIQELKKCVSSKIFSSKIFT